MVLWLADETQRTIFQTSSLRLGQNAVSLQAGETYRATFEMSLNMPYGTFAICVAAIRYDIQKEYDRRAPAAMVYIGSTAGAGGVVNCFPRLVEAETTGAESPQELRHH